MPYKLFFLLLFCSCNPFREEDRAMEAMEQERDSLLRERELLKAMRFKPMPLKESDNDRGMPPVHYIVEWASPGLNLYDKVKVYPMYALPDTGTAEPEISDKALNKE